MPPSKRLILWAHDGPLNARDQVLEYIETMINQTLIEAEGDPCWLNDLMAYFRCLNGVLREAGGQHLISNRVVEWSRRTLSVFDSISTRTPDKLRDERAFIVSVFDDLRQLTKP